MNKMENKDLTSLVGKTIKSFTWVKHKENSEYTTSHFPKEYDDGPYLYIKFTDGFGLILDSSCDEMWTGNSRGEYPTSIVTTVDFPEGYNGPGMYESSLIHPVYGEEDFLGYRIHFGGEVRDVQTSTFRFYAESLEHAKSLLNLDEVEYVKWVGKWPQPLDYDTATPITDNKE